ncbi:MAG TPA: mechanosensitive ion channel family protein [Anaerolineales bacterium]|nr:mechanosensitive ion channel family protein [Anaerolineales bacterium]HRQ91668.1 mechanosensitive ion channel family protein [Anaerolineales bacterium]
MTLIDSIRLWMDTNPQLAPWAVLGTMIVSFLFARYVVGRGLVWLTKSTKNEWDDVLIKHMHPNRLSWVAPFAVIYAFAYLWPQYAPTLQIFALFFILWIVVLTLTSMLTAVNLIYESRANYSGVAIQGYLDLGKMLLLAVGVILSISVISGRSPLLLLGGLGALTAVLLLIFQDTILSLVASVQIAANDLVKEGDWIEVPAFGADGDVSNMSLHTVKVQNFDMTFTVIPTHKLLDVSFKNWRGMSQSGGRRVKRAISLDIQSVRFCTAEEMSKLKQRPLLKDFFANKPDQLTNVSVFMAYVEAYLRQRQDVKKDQTIMVRQLDPGPTGLPIEVYIFTTTTAWPEYEAIQASIFDHLLAIVPEFGLRVFQNPTGADFSSFGSNVAG